MATLPRIVIVGGGFSGTLVAVNLMREATKPFQLTLVERRSELGEGIAYGTQSSAHLLNVPVAGMSALADDREHFLRWLRRHQEENTAIVGGPISASSYVPRKLYAPYLRDLFAKTLAHARTGLEFAQIRDEVIDSKLVGNGYRLRLRGGAELEADAVVLALGNFLPARPVTDTPRFFSSPAYFADPWSQESLEGLAPDRPVLVLGSGLSFVDIALSLQEQGHRGGLHVLSRHGWLPLSHRDGNESEVTLDEDDLDSGRLTELFRSLRRSIERTGSTGGDWRKVMDKLRPETQRIWARLSLQDKKRFGRHLKSLWDIHRHRLAPEIADKLTAFCARGELTVHAGFLRELHDVRDGVDVVFETRRNATRHVLRVQRIINATGPSPRSLLTAQPLLTRLIERGLVRPHPWQGLEATPLGNLKNAAGYPSPTLFALGNLLSGERLETTGVPELREQASHIARQLHSFLAALSVARPHPRNDVLTRQVDAIF